MIRIILFLLMLEFGQRIESSDNIEVNLVYADGNGWQMLSRVSEVA